jgi:N-methylhydantoinase A
VTDANLLLGYLNADYFAGGAFALDTEAAEAALDGLARELGLERIRAAWGVHEVANLEMERALRLVSINRGLDPRDFALVCIGGAAPAHGCRLARSLGVRRVLVPPAAGVGSALGLLAANESFELAQTAIVRLDEPPAANRVRSIFETLETDARRVVGEAWEGETMAVTQTAGLRYAGQGYELEVPAEAGSTDIESLVDAFHAHYERAYGYREALPVEGVTWYLTLTRREVLAEPRAAFPPSAVGRPGTERLAYFPETGSVTVPVVDRLSLGAGDVVEGPALVEEAHTTTVLQPGDVLTVDDRLTLVIEPGGDGGG